MTESIEEASSSDDEMMVDDHELEKFTSSLDQFKPIIPESVTKFYMQKSGLQTDDERVVKLLSLSVQKFMTGIHKNDKRERFFSMLHLCSINRSNQ